MITRKGSVHIIIIALVALALVGGLVFYALKSKSNTRVSPAPTPTPTSSILPTASALPSSNTFSTDQFVLELPLSWTESKSGSSDTVLHYLYTDATTGDYIEIDSLTGGGDKGADAFWYYKFGDTESKSLVPVREEADCDPDAAAFCQKGDSKLQLGIVIEGVPNNQIHGRYFFLSAGNSKSETASRQGLRDIIKTIRQK